jgi:hypothetical protein
MPEPSTLFPGITYSDDEVEWPKRLESQATTYYTIRDIRRERTGVHGFVAIGLNDAILAHDTFNLGRDADRWRLVRSAYDMLGEGHKMALPKEQMRHDLDGLCLWVAHQYEEQRITIEKFDGDDAVDPVTMVLGSYVIDGAGTIIFAPPGAGKSYLCQIWAASIATGVSEFWPVSKRPVLYLNLERSARSMKYRELKVREVLGLHQPTGIYYAHARGKSLATLRRKIASWAKDNPGAVIFLDSISRAAMGDLVSNETANDFINTMNGFGLTWVGIGHTPRESGDHLYGSMHYDAGADVMVSLKSTLADTTRGLALEVTKANDIAWPPQSWFALEFDAVQGLIGFNRAKPDDFPDLAIAKSKIRQIYDYLLIPANRGHDAQQVAQALGLKYDTTRKNITRNEGKLFLKVGYHGWGVLDGTPAP